MVSGLAATSPSEHRGKIQAWRRSARIFTSRFIAMRWAIASPGCFAAWNVVRSFPLARYQITRILISRSRLRTIGTRRCTERGNLQRN